MKKKVLADRYLKMFKSIALGVILSTAGTSAVFAAMPVPQTDTGR